MKFEKLKVTPEIRKYFEIKLLGKVYNLLNPKTNKYEQVLIYKNKTYYF